jgi:serine/threonine protein kinase
MAPEIIESENYDYSVDIWSLGILLYELLMGHSPFKDKTTKNTIVNIKLHELKFDKEISEDCKDLINKLLEVNKEKRFNIKDILTHNFVKKNESLINFISSNKNLKNDEIEKGYSIKNMNTNSNIHLNMNSNDIQISNSSNHFKIDYSRSISSSKYNRSLKSNFNSNSPKKLTNSKQYIFANSSKINLKKNPIFAKIRETMTSEVEKSKKQMEFLNLKKYKRYSFEDIKECNKKMEEGKKNMNSNKPNINRECIKINMIKNQYVQGNDKIFPNFDENNFINELMYICKKHSKEKIIK